MKRRDRGGEIGAAAFNERNRIGGGDVFKDNLEGRKVGQQP